MLTDEMTRLCGEIVAMRGMRSTLINELQRGSKERTVAVGELCAHFSRTRKTIAKQTKNERVAFLNNLKRSVVAQQRHLRSDLSGARSAWAGKSS